MNKTIKKIVALGIGATAIAATVGFAAATTLSDYPQPFVNNGQFVGKIVIGEKANAIDVIGATDIAAALQRDASVATTGTGGTTATASEGVKIRTTGNPFNYGETIGDLKPTMSKSDIPTLLADGTFKEAKGNTDNDVTYTQKLSFDPTTSPKAVFDAKDTGDDAAGDYLFFDSNTDVYTYKLTFDNTVDFDSTSASTIKSDFEGATLNIQGNEYTVTDASGTPGSDFKLKMLAGDTNRWLTQGDQVTVGDHTVSITTVNENEDKCGVKVDGTVAIVDVGDTHTFGDLKVGVLDAVASHAAGSGTAADSCELSIGSSEVVLEDGQAVKLGGTDVDGTTVTFGGSAGHLTSLSITYQPQDNVYLAPGESYVDPALGNFKFVFEGFDKGKTEQIEATTTSSTGKLALLNAEGDKLNIPLIKDGTSVSFGDKKTSALNDVTFGYDANGDRDFADANEFEQVGNLAVGNHYTCVSGTAVTDCEGIKFLAVASGGEARIIKISNIDTTNNQLDLYDETKGQSLNDKPYTDGSATSIDLGYTTVSIKVDETNKAVILATIDNFAGDAGYTNSFTTSLGAEVGLVPTVDNASFQLANVDGKDLQSGAGNEIAKFAVGGTNDDVQVQDFTTNFASNVVEKDGSDWVLATDEASPTWGTIFRYDDSTDHQKLTITYNEDEADAQVFVTPLAATVSTTTSGTGVTVNPIAVGMAITDAEATLGSKPYIVVGGPCANTVAATLMGNTADCTAGFTQGKAIIKLYSSQNALLVAGFGAKDTQGAARVLADYKTYKDKFTGTELEVVTANLNNLQVNKVQ